MKLIHMVPDLAEVGRPAQGLPIGLKHEGQHAQGSVADSNEQPASDSRPIQGLPALQTGRPRLRLSRLTDLEFGPYLSQELDHR